MKLFKQLAQFDFFRANFVMGVGSLAKIISGLMKTKTSAVLLGPAGVGILGLAGQTQLLLMSWGSLSLGAGFVRTASNRIAAGDHVAKRQLYGTTFTMLLLTNALFVVAGLLSLPWLGQMIFDNNESSGYLLPVVVAVPFGAFVSGYFQGILFGHGRYDWWTKSTIHSTFLELVLFVSLTWMYGIIGALWAVSAGILFLAASCIYYCLKLESAKDLFAIKFGRKTFDELSSFMLSGSLTSSAAYLFGVFFRVYLVKRFGTETNGAYQAVCVISGFYTQFLTNNIWAQLVPLVSKRGNKGEVGAAWSESICMTAVAGTICLSALMVAPRLLLSVLFSKSFSGAMDFLPLMLMGDFFFLIAQPSMGVMLAKKKLHAYASVWCLYFTLIAVLVMVLAPALGVMSVGVAHLLANICLALVAMGYYFSSQTKERSHTLSALVWLGGLLLVQFLLLEFLALRQTGVWLRVLTLVCTAIFGVLTIFHYKNSSYLVLPMKTQILNLARSILMIPLVERFAARLAIFTKHQKWIFKSLPNHYQYPKPSFRKVRRNGIHYHLDIADFIDWHIYFGRSEGTKDALYDLAAAGDLVIDIGANIGETALELAQRVGAKGSVVAFEPDPLIREKLSCNIVLNAFENIKVEPWALSDRTAEYKLYRVDARNPAGNQILEACDDDFVLVRAITLDDYLANQQCPKVALIKIDVEGFEMHVLKGSQKTIERDKPKLFVEISADNLKLRHTSSEAVLSQILEWGYKIIRADDGTELTSSQQLRSAQFDVICLPT